MIQVAELADEAVDGTQRIVSSEWDARGLPARRALVFYSLKMQLLHSRPKPGGPDAKESRPWCHSQHGLVDFEEGTHYASVGAGCTTDTSARRQAAKPRWREDLESDEDVSDESEDIDD